jgi:hypothetical protein
MSASLTFGRAVARTAFIFLLLYILSAPQLSSESPGPVFAALQALLRSTPTTTRLLVVGVVLLSLWITTALMRLRAENASTAQEIEDVSAASLTIGDAVSPARGGNGLASTPFVPVLSWLGLAGWLEVKEIDKECLVIDGKHVVRHTQLYIAPMRLLGKPISVRRVLLPPAPLSDVSATALTSDRLNLTLVVSVKYIVADPVYIASLQAPLSELTNLVTGVVAEYIRSDTLENLVRDDGSLRLRLKRRLEESPSIRGKYYIAEVLKALPTGDERIIEIIRQTREAVQKRTLIEQEGQNKVLAADYDLVVEKAKVGLQEEIRQREYAREIEIRQMQQQFESQREMMRMVAAIAASGANPVTAIQEIRSLILGPTLGHAPSSQPHNVFAEDLLGSERGDFERFRERLGIKRFDIQGHINSPGKPGEAYVEFDGFTVLINCPSDYPRHAPTVHVRFDRGGVSPVAIPWHQGSNLLDAATAAMMQAHTMLDTSPK